MIEAMKQALEALDGLYEPGELERVNKAITTLRQAIAEAEKQERFFCERCGKRLSDGIHTCTPPAEAEKQEPVGHADFEINNIYLFNDQEQRVIPEGRQPLYTHPPKRELFELIDENQRLRAELKFNTTKREWVGLTDKDILDALQPHYEEWEASELLDLSSEDYKLIEAKLKEKNT